MLLVSVLHALGVWLQACFEIIQSLVSSCWYQRCGPPGASGLGWWQDYQRISKPVTMHTYSATKQKHEDSFLSYGDQTLLYSAVQMDRCPYPSSRPIPSHSPGVQEEQHWGAVFSCISRDSFACSPMAECGKAHGGELFSNGAQRQNPHKICLVCFPVFLFVCVKSQHLARGWHWMAFFFYIYFFILFI